MKPTTANATVTATANATVTATATATATANSPPMEPPMDSLIQRLKALSSAEDFMLFFGIPYEQRVVQVNRLHILKRFYQYLHKRTDLAVGDDIELFRQYRGLLQQAYDDFVHSNAATEKVFKVFQDADGQKTVTASSLRDSLRQRQAGQRAAA